MILHGLIFFTDIHDVAGRKTWFCGVRILHKGVVVPQKGSDISVTVGSLRPFASKVIQSSFEIEEENHGVLELPPARRQVLALSLQ